MVKNTFSTSLHKFTLQNGKFRTAKEFMNIRMSVGAFSTECRAERKRRKKEKYKGIERFNMEKFSNLPPTKHLQDLEPPVTHITTLSSGLRVASQETYGQLCTFGLLVDAGSRYDAPSEAGATHLMELTAFKSTFQRSHQQVLNEIESMGGMATANATREQLLYCIDCLRDSLEPAMELLADVVLSPQITPQEVQDAKMIMALQQEDLPADMLLKEQLQMAAYKGQTLGRPHFCPPGRVASLDNTLVHNYRAKFLNAPRTVIAGAGVDHQEFVQLVEKFFSGLPVVGSEEIICEPSKYVGGSSTVQQDIKEPFTRIAVGFEVGGWNDDDLVPTCVLQVLLGGGDSFSAGGPGKGMYSRLYREVLNRYYWAEAAEAFTLINSESGLLGIAGASAPEQATHLTHVFCEHFARLATTEVDPIELSRARNMLKCNVLTHLESRLVLFEDIGRQILTHGKRETQHEVCERIDAVTAKDIMRVAQRCLSKPPSISAIGSNVSNVPRYEEVLRWFSQ